MHQINFTRNLNRGEDINERTAITFVTEEVKETI